MSKAKSVIKKPAIKKPATKKPAIKKLAPKKAAIKKSVIKKQLIKKRVLKKPVAKNVTKLVAKKSVIVSTADDAVSLVADLRQLIEQARETAAVAVNVGLTLMHWRIGQRIRAEVLAGQRAVSLREPRSASHGTRAPALR